MERTLKHKRCLYCKKIFFKGQKERLHRWANRNCCCKSHSLKYTWKFSINREEHSRKVSDSWKSKERLESHRKEIKKRWADPEYRKKMSKIHRRTAIEQWKDPGYRKFMSKNTSKQLKEQYANGTRDPKKQTKKARKACFKKYGEGGYLAYAFKIDPDGFHNKIRTAIEEKYGSYLDMLGKKNGAFAGISRAAWGGGSLDKAMICFLENIGKEYVQQFRVNTNKNYRRIDFYIPNEKLFIECDSEAYHSDKEKDRERDKEILEIYPDHTIAHVWYGKGNPKWTYFNISSYE